jgi:hypothetical protein
MSCPDLPVDVISNILRRTSVRELLAAACTSRAWRDGADHAWAALAPRRWRRGGVACPPAGAPPAEWAAYAARRAAVDREALQCLQQMGSVPDAEQALARLCALGPAASDALERAAAWASPRLLGLRHWARAALMEAAGAAGVQRMEEALQGPGGGAPEAMFDAALVIVSRARGRPTAGWWSLGLVQASFWGRRSVARAVRRVAGGVPYADSRRSSSPPSPQNQVLHPLADMGRVRAIVAALSQELRARMRAKGAAPGSELVGVVKERGPEAAG